MYGELIPQGGGDPIPLLKTELLIGRRESCDIVLRFPNVSSNHCQLLIQHGYWYLRDLNSRNGCKVNGTRVTEKRVDPGDQLTIAKHSYEIRYSPTALGATGPPPDDTAVQIFSKSLLERAGLVKARPQDLGPDDRAGSGRYNVNSDAPGQIKNPHRNL